MDSVLKEIQADIEYLTRVLADGSAQDYADYKWLCGKLEGLRLTEERILELKKRLEGGEDD